MRAFIDINGDRSERVRYDRAEFPAYIRRGRLSYYLNYAAESHWHDDVELILVVSGHMWYSVNGETVYLREGEGIFVNARRLHFGYSEDHSECDFLCVLLHPVLLCASRRVEQCYVAPLLQSGVPFWRLTPDTTWGKTVLEAIRTMYAVRDDAAAELKIQRAFTDVWLALYENALPSQPEVPRNESRLSALKEMMSFIGAHSGERLTLERIARAGGVGKTSCCALFRRYLHKTPTDYVTELRLRRGAELLRSTDRTVTEIAYEVGFSGASYFTEQFRRTYGVTPTAYRAPAESTCHRHR